MSKHAPHEPKLRGKQLSELHQPRLRSSLRRRNSEAPAKGANTNNQYR